MTHHVQWVKCGIIMNKRNQKYHQLMSPLLKVVIHGYNNHLADFIRIFFLSILNIQCKYLLL